MNLEASSPQSAEDADASLQSGIESEVFGLIDTLAETDRRLEELTSGQVDSVSDRHGRSYLLRRSQLQLCYTEAGKQAAILDASPAHVALLDAKGHIVSVNQLWRGAAFANAFLDPDCEIGASYLADCENATGASGSDGFHVVLGIRSVLRGTAKSFCIEYSCKSPSEERWFALTATPLDENRAMGAVVRHLDITDRKRHESAMRCFVDGMDVISDALYLVDRDTMRLIHVNDAGCRAHDRPREALLAADPWEVFSMTRTELERCYDGVIAGGGDAEPVEGQRRRADGSPYWVEVRLHAQCYGDKWTILTMVRDITQRKEAENRIVYLTRVYAMLSGVNMLILRVRGRDELFRETCRIAVEAGRFPMTWIGMVDRALGRIVPVASAGADNEYLRALSQALATEEIAQPGNVMSARAIREKRIILSNDTQSDAKLLFGDLHASRGIHSIAIFPLIVGEEAVGVFVLYAAEIEFFHSDELKPLTEMAGDVSFAIAHIAERERRDFLECHDQLTGLANRGLFLERVAQFMDAATAGGHKFALCLFDLERFKNFNDSLGRLAGDALLRQVAQWLTAETGDAMAVARVDADHFALVIPEIQQESEVERWVERAINSLQNQSFDVDGVVYRIAAKVGVALYPDDGADADALFKNAEAALKKAKNAGDRYLFYAQRMTETAIIQLSLENQLRQAVERREFVLYYQPKINLASGRLAGAEALIRWNDPRSGLVAPGRFIPILEETGLIHEVGRWALNTALEDYMRWRSAGLPAVRIAVNVSPLQLLNREFIADVRQAIGPDERAAEGLGLEITESMIMRDVERSIASLQEIRAMGVRIAIDDFGTGFSSLSYLAKLPVDTLKIDKSFVADMTQGPAQMSLVSIIINMAHLLQLEVVAEGVETVEQARLLGLLRCDEMQGYLIGTPLPASAFEAKCLRPPPAGGVEAGVNGDADAGPGAEAAMSYGLA
jgi:diguanylate cyclase (GGDEF)-like protein/PAS domain S-box-containing protein